MVKYQGSCQSLPRKGKRREIRLSRLTMLIATPVALGILSSPGWAGDYFNPNALELKDSSQQAINLEQFLSQGQQLPGTYRVDLYLNGNQIDSRDVTFILVDGKLQPELTTAELKAMGVKVEAFPALSQKPPNVPFADLANDLPDADTTFNFNQQRLNISIPQAALDAEARGYVDPALWDQGLPALLLNYGFSGANTRYDNKPGTSDSYYLNLRTGANLGAWRLRNYSTYTDSSGGERSWDNISTYLERDIQRLKGQLTLGDSYSPGDIFDSVQFRGAQLASDDNMLPDSLRGFAPVIRGIAQSNAQVTVRQNGYIIYQSYVAPGAFAITDLYPTSSSGDLDITITEADGTERHSVQPFSAVPIMLREGQLKYALTGGEYRTPQDGARTPNFVQSTLIYGLPYDSTVYGGMQFSDKYNAFALGMGHGFGDWGSISFDVMQANTELRNNDRSSGQSYRFQYAKDINETGTTFTLAGYRYSTSGFYDFKEANELDTSQGNGWRYGYNKRSKAQANINQNLNGFGNFYLSAYQQDYWQQSGFERNLSAGYNLSLDGISYGLSYTYSQTPGNNANDQQFAFNVQVPLSKWLPNSWANYSVNSSKQGRTTQQVGLSGTTLADNNLNYSIQQSYANQGGGNSGNLNANYKGSYGNIDGGYNYNQGSRQINYGLQGGIVAHPYGVTFSQPLGETTVLVKATGADNLKVQNSTGVYTDWRGYAVVPYVSSYRNNRIALDTASMGEGIDIDTNTQTVVPTKGAMVLANFKTRVGSRVLMTLNYQGKPVPFGATASLVQEDSDTENSAIVGPEGQVYLSGVPDKGQLQVKWGNAVNQQCQVKFTLPVSDKASSVTLSDFTCR